jgi:hypothetical protein
MPKVKQGKFCIPGHSSIDFGGDRLSTRFDDSFARFVPALLLTHTRFWTLIIKRQPIMATSNRIGQIDVFRSFIKSCSSFSFSPFSTADGWLIGELNIHHQDAR